ncbi:hypothetical protein EP47_05015 [Legionella norrlandica]|uniref:Flagellar hook-basal body complex protein FliE n=1 Tax=Legionella norrlandica TaxID=1498499 RepID=A0A0A2SRH0_9GAMM|nr:flagellar hook-basal body complex protein FliE [Legionella norrlandica]KGP63725.1 hypothetical protein EP47_05015 [Legionella norrlandica]
MTVPAISKAQIMDTLTKIRSISEKPQLDNLNIKKTQSGFGEIMGAAKSALSTINQTQNAAESLKESYLKGDIKVSLPQVLISAIHSKVAFEGLLVVRNKLIDAYKEIMSMPI